MEEAEDTEEMLYRPWTIKMLIWSLEAGIKVKSKEIAYDQSQHLANLIQTIVETETYKTKIYVWKVLKTVQNDLMEKDQETNE